MTGVPTMRRGREGTGPGGVMATHGQQEHGAIRATVGPAIPREEGGRHRPPAPLRGAGRSPLTLVPNWTDEVDGHQ